jgi:cAMP phosphodiesterase
MKIKVLGAFGSEGLGQRPSAFLVNDKILLDAGTVPGALSVEEQTEISSAILSHAHLDHTVGLAFLTDTLATTGDHPPITAIGTAPVIDALRTHAFNSVLWPNFNAIPSREAPVLAYRVVEEEVEQPVGDLWVTPIQVNHSVPANGFILRNGEVSLIYTGDTGPTERLWAAARGVRGLRAIIIESAFPSRLETLARAAGHMTPSLLERELAKMPADVPIWVFHIKPPFYQEIAEELAKIDPERIQILEQGKTYFI